MNWESVSAITEVVGLTAVIVTLLYLARQLRQHNELLNAEASYQMLQNQLSYYDGIARDPELVNIIYGIPKEDQALIE